MSLQILQSYVQDWVDRWPIVCAMLVMQKGE